MTTLTLTVPEVLGILALAVAVWRLVVWRIDKLGEKNEKAHAATTESVKAAKDDLGTQIDRVANEVGRVANEVGRVAHDVTFMAGRQAERDNVPAARMGQQPPGVPYPDPSAPTEH